MSFEIRRKPIGLPALSRRGVITTRALMRLPSLRTRPITPSHLPSRSAASMIWCGLPLATSSGVCRTFEFSLPTTSRASYPYIRRAPSFQRRIFPSRSLPITEYSVDASRMLLTNSTACCAVPRMALSKRFDFMRPPLRGNYRGAMRCFEGHGKGRCREQQYLSQTAEPIAIGEAYSSHPGSLTVSRNDVTKPLPPHRSGHRLAIDEGSPFRRTFWNVGNTFGENQCCPN